MISVIMPVYNAEKYLEVAIKSILNQTYSKFEFLILNDFSTDDSISIINRYKKLDNRIRVFSFKKKMGLVKLLNFSLNKANYKYLARMDSDDISHENRLKIQLNYLLKNPKVGVVGSFVKIIDNKGVLKKLWKYPVTNADIKKHLAYESCIPHPATMMNAKYVKAVGGYREIAELVEDYDLWTRLSCVCEMANIPYFLFSYREHKSSSSYKQKRKQVLNREFVRYNYKYLQNNSDLISVNKIAVLNKKTVSKLTNNYFSAQFALDTIKLDYKNKKIQYLINFFFFITRNPSYAIDKFILFVKRNFYY